MKTKNFTEYLEKRLTKIEINEITKQAELEKKFFESLQSDIAIAVANYMNYEKIGFNEFGRRLGISPSQIVKIQRGKANFTIATIAHIFALLNQQPHITYTAPAQN